MPQVPPLAIKLVTASMAVGGLGMAGYSAYTTFERVSDGFVRKGWAEQLRAGTQPFAFSFKCAGNVPCWTLYKNVYKRSYPLWPGIMMIAGLFGFGIAKRMGAERFAVKNPGYARFATSADEPIQKYIKPFVPWDAPKGTPDQRRGYLGLMEDGTLMKAPMGLRCSHAAIVGGPGARKSTGYHKPNMVMDAVEASSAVVIDLKYPDPKGGFFDMCPAFFNMKRDIQVFTPFDRNTMRLNLLETAVDIDSALDLASMILPVKEEGAASFYKNIERTVLGALLLAVATSDQPSMKMVYKKIIAGPAALKEYILSHPDETVKETAAAMLQIKVDQLTGIVASLQNMLAIFNSAELSRSTTPRAGNNLDLKRCFTQPTLLYIGIPQGKIIGGKGQTLLQLVKRSIDQAMFDVAELHNGKLPVHTVFYLDEFANLGPLPNIGQNFATMRSYNVSYQVTLQNRAQGEALYGITEFKSFFENNLQFQIIFPAFLKMSDAELYSKAMGKMTVQRTSNGISKPLAMIPTDQRISETVSLNSQELVTPDEMLDWPPEVAIIFMIGVRPIQAFMPRLDESKIKIKDSRGRIRWLNNPLHRYWGELNLGEDPAKFMETFIGGRQMAGEEEENESGFAEIGPEERFRAWILNIIENGAHVAPYAKDNKANIFKKDLPSWATSNPEIEEFAQKGYMTSTEDRYKVTKEGSKVIGQDLFKRLCQLELTGRLKLWIARNATKLRGHPYAEGTVLADQEEPFGIYDEATVTLTKEEAEKVFDRVPPEKYRTRVGSKTYYKIPINEQVMMEIYQVQANTKGTPIGMNANLMKEAGASEAQAGSQAPAVSQPPAAAQAPRTPHTGSATPSAQTVRLSQPIQPQPIQPQPAQPAQPQPAAAARPQIKPLGAKTPPPVRRPDATVVAAATPTAAAAAPTAAAAAAKSAPGSGPLDAVIDSRLLPDAQGNFKVAGMTVSIRELEGFDLDDPTLPDALATLIRDREAMLKQQAALKKASTAQPAQQPVQQPAQRAPAPATRNDETSASPQNILHQASRPVADNLPRPQREDRPKTSAARPPAADRPAAQDASTAESTQSRPAPDRAPPGRPETETPDSGSAKASVPGAQLPGAQLPGAQLPGAQLPGEKTPGGQVSPARRPAHRKPPK